MHKAAYSISTQYTLYYNLVATIVNTTRHFNTAGIEVGLDDGLRACEPVGRPREPTTPPPRKVSTGFAVVCIVLAVPLCALVVPDFLLTPLPLLADFGVA